MRSQQVWQLLRSAVLSFCANSNIHGLRYISNSRLHLFNRLFWTLTLIGAFSLSLVLSVLAWERFRHSPTHISMSTGAYSVLRIPFPAVTICTHRRVYGPKAKEMARELQILKINYNRTLEFLSKLDALAAPSDINLSGVEEIQEKLVNEGIELGWLSEQLAQPCTSLIRGCIWLNRSWDCTRIFRMVLTDRGYCCSFNYQLDLLDEFSATDDIDDLYIGSPIHSVSLVVVLEPESITDNSLSVSIHDPYNFPEIDLHSCVVDVGEFTWVYVTPIHIDSTDAVQRVSPEQRNCVFNNEVLLDSSSHYSYSTCLRECRIRNIVKLCGCVPFYYPRIKGFWIKNCSLSDAPCLYKQNVKVASNEEGCSCLPKCIGKTYSQDCFSTAMRNGLNTAYPDSLLRNLNISQLAIISVGWSTLFATAYLRDVSLTWDAFLACFGGIMGLCLGFSILSVAEILYFFTIRLFSNISKPTVTSTIAADSLFRTRENTLFLTQLFWQTQARPLRNLKPTGTIFNIPLSRNALKNRMP